LLRYILKNSFTEKNTKAEIANKEIKTDLFSNI